MTCTGPDAKYHCVIGGDASVAARSSRGQMLCITQLAQSGGHASCSVSRTTTEPCEGKLRTVMFPPGEANPRRPWPTRLRRWRRPRDRSAAASDSSRRAACPDRRRPAALHLRRVLRNRLRYGRRNCLQDRQRHRRRPQEGGRGRDQHRGQDRQGDRARRVEDVEVPQLVLRRLLGASRRSSVRRDPFARELLGARDIVLRHLLGDLEPVALGILVAAQGCEVEPLVRLDEIECRRRGPTQ